jgi:hypothetical protein
MKFGVCVGQAILYGLAVEKEPIPPVEVLIWRKSVFVLWGIKQTEGGSLGDASQDIIFRSRRRGSKMLATRPSLVV